MIPWFSCICFGQKWSWEGSGGRALADVQNGRIPLLDQMLVSTRCHTGNASVCELGLQLLFIHKGKSLVCHPFTLPLKFDHQR